MWDILLVLAVFLEVSYVIYVSYVASAVIKFKNTTSNHTSKESAQLLVCQYNESNNLEHFYKNIAAQDYPSLQILVIDDYSTDDSFEKLITLTKNQPHWQIHRNQAEKGKKKAMDQAYRLSSKKLLLLTDMDCTPASDRWSSLMLTMLGSHQAVIGYAPFFKENKRFNSLQRYENCWAAIQYLGSAIRGHGYMAVGRNMAVRKEVYEQKADLRKGKELLSGDDDMLIQALDRDAIGVQMDPDSFVYSNAETSYISWLRQKSRQISTSWHYRKSDQVLLALSAVFSVFLPPLLLILLFFQTSWIPLILIGLHLLIGISVKGRAFAKLEEGDLIYCMPVLEFLYGCHLLVLAVFSFFYKKNQWK